MATRTGKVTWLGNGVAKELRTPQMDTPIGVGEAITLTQGQVTALEAAGHRFAKPGSEEAEAAKQQAANPPAPSVPAPATDAPQQ